MGSGRSNGWSSRLGWDDHERPPRTFHLPRPPSARPHRRSSPPYNAQAALQRHPLPRQRRHRLPQGAALQSVSLFFLIRCPCRTPTGPTERLADAWQNTPTTWYPLPIAAGALLLIFIQYRRKSATKEVVVDEHGNEVIRLKGPWHVCTLLACLLCAHHIGCVTAHCLC